jgi:FkbM family methyltransferase
MAHPQAIVHVSKLVANHKPDLQITMLEVGARPLSSDREPYWVLLDVFPNAHIHAFEVDEALCIELNQTAPKKVTYHPLALGRPERNRIFYETVRPMCSSFYKPNEELLKKYSKLDASLIKAEHRLDSHALDEFVMLKSIPNVDLIKADIQGAELELFEYGTKAIHSASMVITEAEFIELYEDQPLFRDVDKFLSSQGLMLQKILYTQGSSLKPIQLSEQLPASQTMWCDAIYTKHIINMADQTEDTLLKIAIFAFIYDSPDLSYHCLTLVDQKVGSGLANQFASLGNK